MKNYIIAPAVGFVFMTLLLTSCNSDVTSNSEGNNQEAPLTTTIFTSESTVTEYTGTAASESVNTDYTVSELSSTETFMTSSYSENVIDETKSSSDIAAESKNSEKNDFKPADNIVQVTTKNESFNITGATTEIGSVHKTESEKTDSTEEQIKINEDGELELPEVLF